MTAELVKLIKDRVGQDVDTEGLSVFEAIALNTKPLPGKDGTVHENAVITPLTLRQMADHINAGNHLPLISDHQLMGEPKGRVFSADAMYGNRGEMELRVLFYLDSTERRLVQKLNAASLDEVSVSFMPTEFLCSECGWDYFSPQATFDNLLSRTCGNGHKIGTNGVHAELVGLSDFVEVSLVARGAADQPKIVGSSESKLAPATALRLTARGFDQNSLLVQATQGVSRVADFDMTKFVTDLAAERANVITLTAQVSAVEAERDNARAQLTTLSAEVEDLKGQIATLQASADEGTPNETEAAVGFLRAQLSKLKVAKGEAEPALDSLPSTVAELETEIRSLTADLTAILPVGGVALTQEPEQPKTFASTAFRVRSN